jgi:hypothetical protein
MLASTFTTAAVAAIVALASNPMTLFALGATALGGLYLRFIKGTARQALVETLTKRAFNCVEDLKAQGKLPPGTDKPVLALEFLAKQLSAHGLTLTTGIEDLARAIWSSMHAPESEVTTTATASTAGFKATAQIVETPAPTARRVGFIGAALLAFVLLMPTAARAQVAPVATPSTPSNATPTPSRFGGCVGPWTCFAPAVVVVPIAINLRTKVLEAGFQPGLCYGVSIHSEAWWGFGADVCGDLNVGAQTASIAVMGSFLGGWGRFGWSKGFIGDSNATAPRLLLGLGVAIP